MRGRSNRDLVAACLWATATVAAVAVSDSLLLRTILGAPLVLFVAGHALVRAIGIRTTSISEHLAYAIAASLGVGIIGGFALNAAGWLTPFGWAAWFWVATASATLVAKRQQDIPDLPVWPSLAQVRPWHKIALALSVLVATGAYALAMRDEAANRQFRYTALWMVPQPHGKPNHVTVGIRSDETETQHFILEITFGGRPFAIFRSLTIEPGATWTYEIPVPVLASQQKAEARLYRPADNRLYRNVSMLPPT